MTHDPTRPATDDLIERMAIEICENLGIRSWASTPFDHGDLRNRIRDREQYDINEPNRMDYMDAAQAALSVLRDEARGHAAALREKAASYFDEYEMEHGVIIAAAAFLERIAHD